MQYLVNNGKKLVHAGKLINHKTKFDDWYLPSLNELIAMYNELKVNGFGNFTTSIYWSSSEFSAANANFVSFFTGASENNIPKGQLEITRASRSFSGTLGDYSYTDTGPAGGWIYHFDNSTYYEAAPEDLSNSVWSYINLSIGTTSTNIGTGQANTQAIIDQIGHTGSAAKLCNDLVIYN